MSTSFQRARQALVVILIGISVLFGFLKQVKVIFNSAEALRSFKAEPGTEASRRDLGSTSSDEYFYDLQYGAAPALVKKPTHDE